MDIEVGCGDSYWKGMSFALHLLFALSFFFYAYVVCLYITFEAMR
jgi:hypothetical protein